MRPPTRRHTLLTFALALAGLLVVASSAIAALGDRTLRQGMEGADVLELQRDVTYLGYPTPRYGTFTSRTKQDILHYERSTGLTVDGVVSTAEGRAIVRRTAEKEAREGGGAYQYGERVQRRGLRGGDVLTLQRYVTRLGYATPRYGRYTSRTERDMVRYERATGLSDNGIVSRAEQRTIKRRVGSASAGTTGHTHVFPIRGAHSYGGSGSRYGAPRSGHRHGGQDLAAAAGTPLVAVTNGRVSYRQYQSGGAGHYVVIQGDDRRDYVYMHMIERAEVAPGTRVRMGQRIGRVGSTGASTGPHLHFEMWTPHWYDGGHHFDPLPYLQRWDAYS